MSSQAGKSADTVIQEARQHYAEKRFKPALEQFTRAMRLCPCARGMKRDRCSCKNFEQVALDDGSIFNEAMYNCKCSVGKTFNKCDKSLHIQALDYRAATFEALGEFARAQRDAEWILELAPRLLEGYLRLGKIARLQKKYEFAWKVYNAGIEVGTKHGLAGDPKMQTLYKLRRPLHLRYVRVDPLKNPLEIVQRIFHYLDFPSLVRCLAVCKSWRRYLSGRGNERLWRSLIFTKKFPHRHAPNMVTLRKLLSYSRNDARVLIIDDVLRFRLIQPKLLAICQNAKNLERLTLGGVISDPLQIPRNPPVFTKLTHLDLREIIGEKPELLNPLLYNASQHLQDLRVAGLPQVGSRTDLQFPHLPHLKYLRLEEHSRPYPLRLEIFLIAAKTPSLEQLWLSDVQLGTGGLQEGQLDTIWPSLKTVVISGTTDSDPETSENIRRLTSIRQGSSLQHIDFDFRWKYDEHGPLGLRLVADLLNHQSPSVVTGAPDENNYYRELRSLRLSRALITPSKLQEVVADAVVAGKLHTLDLVFPLEPFGVPQGSTSTQHLREHAWLRGASSIRCLGISEFRFRSFPKDDDDLPLPGFLSSFPNLETLEINSAHYEGPELFTVLRAILNVTKLKRLYQTAMHGLALDHLRALTAELGVELICGERPREWPMSIDE